MRLRTILIGGAIVVVSFLGASLAMQMLSPGPGPDRRPALVEVPPLKQISRTSMIVTPTAIALTAIRDALEATAPRNLTGKRDNPVTSLLSNADIGWTMGRGPLTVAGRPEGLAVSTLLNGTLHVTGQLSTQAGNLGGALGNIINQNLGQNLQNLTGKTLDQHADVRGNVTLISRPALTANWRLEPNLTAQVAVGDSALSIAGIKIAVSNEVKPLLDKQVNEQVAALQARLRADPFLEVAARRQWAKLCRSVSLGAGGAGLPDLWLEIRPTRAFAAQPRIDASAVNLVIGVQAETRVVPAQTTPDCPFPAALELVPQSDAGPPQHRGADRCAVHRGQPAVGPAAHRQDLSAGRQRPLRGYHPRRQHRRLRGPAAAVAPRQGPREGELVRAGGEANVNVWGRPVLDPEHQTVRLTDIALDVDSQDAFGLLGAAARAAIPYLKDTLADNAVIDLKPFADHARASMEAAIADFRTVAAGVRADVNITDLRLLGIEFDAKTLRVIAEVNGTASVAVSSLQAQ